MLIFSENKQTHPLLDFSVFKNRGFTLICIIRCVVNMLFFGLLFVLPLYLQTGLHYSPFGSGIIMVCFTAFLGLFSLLVGKWYQIYGARRILGFGFFMWLLGLLLLSLLSSKLFVVCLALMFAGCGLALMIVPCSTYAMQVVEESRRGAATGIYYCLAFVATCFGVALSGVIIAMRSSRYLHDAVNFSNYSTATQTIMLAKAHGLSNGKEILLAAQQSLATHAFFAGHFTYFIIALLCFTAGWMLVAFLPRLTHTRVTAH
jgi:MFS family permease